MSHGQSSFKNEEVQHQYSSYCFFTFENFQPKIHEAVSLSILRPSSELFCINVEIAMRLLNAHLIRVTITDGDVPPPLPGASE